MLETFHCKYPQIPPPPPPIERLYDWWNKRNERKFKEILVIVQNNLHGVAKGGRRIEKHTQQSPCFVWYFTTISSFKCSIPFSYDHLLSVRLHSQLPFLKIVRIDLQKFKFYFESGGGGVFFIQNWTFTGTYYGLWYSVLTCFHRDQWSRKSPPPHYISKYWKGTPIAAR